MGSVVIVDYQLSNLFSVKHACNYTGINAKISADPTDIANADAIILPGVGAFHTAMNNLEKLGLVKPIKDFIGSGKPFFGICLGLQLLFLSSEEFGKSKGLGLVKGTIKKFPNLIDNENSYKVPQIGWNQINSPKGKGFNGTPLENMKDGEFVYFVHSFYAQVEEKRDLLSLTNYSNIEYCSGIFKNNNIFAVQFHPEKSGVKGLEIYKTWALQNNLI